MKKSFFFLALLLPMLALFSCGDEAIVEKPDEPIDPQDPTTPIDPLAILEVLDVNPTTATFKITTDIANDFAYAVVAEGESYEKAEDLFSKGTVKAFDETHEATVEVDGLAAETKYNLFVATRCKGEQQTTYSEVVSDKLSTPTYKDIITISKVDYTSYAYHVNMKAGMKYKHISVRKVDFDWIADKVGATLTSYVDTFGFTEDKPGDFEYDEYLEDVFGGPVNIYPDDTYIVIVSALDSDGKCYEPTTVSKTLTTKKCNVSAHDIKVVASDVQSTTASVTITPDEGIAFYRYNVQTKKDFDYAAREGEQSVRSMIIGNWRDTKNEAKEQLTVDLKGLQPSTKYIAGVIGFDNQHGMKHIMYEFTTAAPSGPKPVIKITENEVDDPATKAAYTVFLENAVQGTVDIHTKAQYEDVLSRPGVELEDVVKNNGKPLQPDELTEALSEKGLPFLLEKLQPETDYVLGVYAENDEFVAVVDTVMFRTAQRAEAGGDVKANMPGKYTASITTSKGDILSFPVEIKTGVNEATRNEYAPKNRLVCLGYGLKDYPLMMPEDLMKDGCTEEDANKNYGPKWFIEFQGDGTVSTPQLVDYELDFNVYNYRQCEVGFCGYAQKEDGEFIDSQCVFPIEVSADGNTIRVKPCEMTSEWSGETFVYYPGAMQKTSKWSGNPIWIGRSDLVLVRNSDQTPAPGHRFSASDFAKKLSVPERVTINMTGSEANSTVSDERLKAAEHIH